MLKTKVVYELNGFILSADLSGSLAVNDQKQLADALAKYHGVETNKIRIIGKSECPSR